MCFHLGFNSTVVRLILGSICISLPACPCFNSTVVRLILFPVRHKVQHLQEFQFYSSPINTYDINVIGLLSVLFQFYSSPINTTVQPLGGEVVPGFNSTVVRLIHLREYTTTIQSISFNSTVVRLIPLTNLCLPGAKLSFNSTVVRLIQATARECACKGQKFQFYSSPINT